MRALKKIIKPTYLINCLLVMCLLPVASNASQLGDDVITSRNLFSDKILGMDGYWDLSTATYVWIPDYPETVLSIFKKTNFIFKPTHNNSVANSRSMSPQGPTPTATVFAIQPSCNSGIPNNDGYLQISAVTNGDRVAFSVGSIFSGDTNYANAMPIGTLPFQFATGQSNPSGAQAYTIRVFNGESSCFTDTVVMMKEQDCSFACDCEEYVYLNEIENGGKVHKYQVQSDGSLFEVLNGGNAWYPGNTTSELPFPHGLAFDLNGLLYIAETFDAPGQVRRLTCDGEIKPESEFMVESGHLTANLASIGNTLYTNTGLSFDLCTGDSLGSVCFNGIDNTRERWGFWYDKTTGYFYSTSSHVQPGHLYRYTADDFGSGTCIDPFINDADIYGIYQDSFSVTLNSRRTRTRGVTTDELGNIYLTLWLNSTSAKNGAVIKFSPDGNTILAHTAVDRIDGDGGWFWATSPVYSINTGILYVSTQSLTESCVYAFNASDLSPIGEVVSPSGNSGQGQTGLGQAKAMAILTECCPVNNNIIIDTVLCDAALNDSLILRDLINCDGIICEGLWEAGASNSGLSYNSCSNTVKITSLNACGTFTLASNGVGNNPQCGAFKIVVKIKIENVTTPTITAGTTPVCANNNDPGAINISTASTGSSTVSYRWQSSTTSCSAGFVDIADAPSDGSAYDPSTIAQETYYRVIAEVNNATCVSGVCADTSNCVMLTPEAGCCIYPTSSIFAIQPSCTNGVAGSDGYLQLSGVINGDRLAFSTGNTFTGNADYANATTIGALPFQFNTGLSNPSGSQAYTVRVFNGQSSCFVDVVVTMNEQDCTVGCDCEEYLYLNETTDNGSIHKYTINENFNPATDPASAVFTTEIGTPWYDNTAAGETLSNPHGLGVDLNGFLYIGESGNADNGAAIRKLTCDGEIIPSTTFEIPDEGGKNFASANGILYVNTDSESNSSIAGNVINAYDLCTGNLIGFYCLDGIKARRDWGMYLEDDGIMYLTSSYLSANQGSQPDNLWKFNINTATLNAVGNPTPTCISPFLTETSSPPTIGQSHFARGLLWGVTVDNNGNIYVVETIQNSELDKPASSVGFRTARILKYDSNGILTAMTPWDTAEDGVGWYRAIGIYYNETIDKLFVSTTSGVDDCVSLFDTSLNYLGAAVPSPGDGSQGKGINVLSECCPTNNNMTIDTTLCSVAVNDDIFLQEMIDCSGTICEGIWAEGSANKGITFNSCNNSITIDALNACGTFTLESDGMGNNPQCGAFKITLNISVATITAPIVAGDQTICSGGNPAAFTVTTAASGSSAITYQWQSSTTSCTVGFSNISGAISDTYDASAITENTYFRVLSSSAGGCGTGACIDTSNCLTITVQDCDWGDLPDVTNGVSINDYQTTNANNGPVHVITPGLSLGATVDGETDGQPSTDALGDGLDEDGLTIFESMDVTHGGTIRLPLNYTNTTGMTAYIEAWIDWNANGEFDAGELVLDVSDMGDNAYDKLEVSVPNDAITGEFLGLRIRISQQDNMTPYGKIDSGEIEDYLIGLDCKTQICLPINSILKRK